MNSNYDFCKEWVSVVREPETTVVINGGKIEIVNDKKPKIEMVETENSEENSEENEQEEN